MSTNKFSTYNFRIDLGLQNIPVVFFNPDGDDISKCLCNKRVKQTEKKAIPVRHFGLGFGSGFSGIREFSGFRIGFGYRKNFGFRFRVSKVPVRVWVLGSVCLSALSFCFFSHFNFLFRIFNCNSLGYSNMFVAVKLSMVL